MELLFLPPLPMEGVDLGVRDLALFLLWIFGEVDGDGGVGYQGCQDENGVLGESEDGDVDFFGVITSTEELERFGGSRLDVGLGMTSRLMSQSASWNSSSSSSSSPSSSSSSPISSSSWSVSSPSSSSSADSVDFSSFWM